MTDTPQTYLRRCNGRPESGLEETRADAEGIVAHLSRFAVDTVGDLDSGLTIRTAAGHRDAGEVHGAVERVFTFEPLPSGQRRAPSN